MKVDNFNSPTFLLSSIFILPSLPNMVMKVE